MKTTFLSMRSFGLEMAVLSGPLTSEAQTQLAANNAANHPANRFAPISIDQPWTVAGKQYQGDGLSTTALAPRLFYRVGVR